MGATNEEILIQRATQGDRDAMVSLLESHDHTVRRRIEPRIPQKYRSMIGVDDVMQQTFVDACREIRKFEPQSVHSFAAWVETIAERNLLDAVRMLDAKKRGGDRRRVTAPAREDSCRDLVDLLAASQTTPSRVIVGREAIEQLEQALQSLPEVYHNVVEMYDLQGRSIDDVSRELGRSPGAIYMLRARAHRMLAEILGSSSSFFSDNA